MPLSVTALLRVVVLGLMAAHVFYFYGYARLLQDTVGLDVLTILTSAALGLVMLVPLAWAVALPDLPLVVRAQVGRRRWQQGRCPGCGHFLVGAPGTTCPECGSDRSQPAFELGWGTVRRFAVMAVVAWVLGCVASETWLGLDERAFAREARAHLAEHPGDHHYTRHRAWPMNDQTLHYTPTSGVTAYAPNLVLPD